MFWVNQNGNYLPGKSISRRKKKSGKMTLPPPKNFPVTALHYTVEANPLFTSHHNNGFSSCLIDVTVDRLSKNGEEEEEEENTITFRLKCIVIA